MTVARTWEELDALVPAWEELQGDSLSTDPGFFSTLVRHDPRMIRPHVVLAEGEDGRRCLVVARLENATLPCRVGYRTVYAPRVRSLTVSYRGVLGEQDGACAGAAFEALRVAVDDAEADVVSFRQLAESSPFHALVDDVRPRACRQLAAERSGTSFELALPDTYEDFLAGLSSAKRASVRRGARRLQAELGDRLELRRLREPEDLDEIFALVSAVSATTYQEGLGRAFADRPETRARIGLGLERGWFRAWVLLLDRAPVAFWTGWAYRGRFGWGGTGYDPAYGALGVGTFLLHRMIEDLCADPEVHTMDLGFGEADYKRSLATSSWGEETRLVYARRLGPMRINVTRTALLATTGWARRVAERLGLSRRLRSTWRRRLARPGPGDRAPQT